VSNLVKGVKKVFKKTIEVAKKIAPYVAMGAAIYFTAGLAMAAFPATASVAAAMPGISGAASALGIGSAAAGTAAATSEAAAALPTFAGVAEDLAPITVNASMLTAGPAAAAAASGAGLASAAAGVASGAPVASLMGGWTTAGARGRAEPLLENLQRRQRRAKSMAAGVKSMSFSDKLLLASVGAQTLGNYLGPTADDIARDQAIERAKFRGSFYGIDESGQPAKPNTTGVRPLGGPGTVNPTPPAPASAPRDLFAPKGTTNLLPSVGGVGTQNYAQFASQLGDPNNA
jgi:hypothetical protein